MLCTTPSGERAYTTEAVIVSAMLSSTTSKPCLQASANTGHSKHLRTKPIARACLGHGHFDPQQPSAYGLNFVVTSTMTHDMRGRWAKWYLQNDKLGVLPAVKELLHDEFVMAGYAVVCYRLILPLCWEVVCFNMLHVENGRSMAAC